MYEYVFFNEVLCSRFVAVLADQGQACERREGHESASVFVDEDIDDDRLLREIAIDELQAMVQSIAGQVRAGGGEVLCKKC